MPRAVHFRASLLVVALVGAAAPARGAPPLPEPAVPVDAGATQQPPGPSPAPAAAPDSAAPSSPAPAADTSSESPFAPPPNLKKNPIDILPGDVVYPPLGDRNVKPVLWDPEWARFSTADWIITGAGVAVALGAAIVPPFQSHWRGGVLVDESARKALRLPTYEGRTIARDASDIIVSLEATWPLFVDSLITTWWYRGSPDAAAQMALVDGQALALVTAIQGATNTVASRERPYGRTCGTLDQPDATGECKFNDRYRSFFSGHTAFAFMSAGLICVHHTKLGLLGATGDTLSCAVAYGGAAATGVLRVVGDKHYLSDVVVAAGVGTLIGVGVPLWHYRRVNLAPKEKTGVELQIIPVGAGLGLGGRF